MPRKILFCATVDYHFQAFHLPQMKWFQEQGWEVHVAASGNIDLEYTDKKFTIPIARSPFKFSNIQAYKDLKQIIDDNHYSMIHCHTPLGGVITRLAAFGSRKRRVSHVLYTAHGFHFCHGSPISNWLLYYPVERFLSGYTDTLITINEEDHLLATKRLLAKEIKHVHGVGVNTSKFKALNQKEKKEGRKSLGYSPDGFLLFYGAEFNKNKNQQLLLKAMAIIIVKRPNTRLLLAGPGSYQSCDKLAKSLEIDNYIDFLGMRNDIDTLLPICDVAVGSSLREGLPVNIMEAMACQLPVVATENRGHSELIRNDHNGWTVKQDDPMEFAEMIIQLMDNEGLRIKFGKAGREMIEEKYSLTRVLQEQTNIYSKYMEEEGAISWAVQ
ncbi:glycosyltransferase family 1 protein [Salipaludibacillus neizhouensis]|uniref:Glycosyltransferase family 1 protein n=1 Tax=Salipaludibacillus neizhouensis TaxID=885475 RepID=A0A3A9K6D0_9BACI|nr:glycosyltransferase family 4 protein [Salipaludibacillus neizhouensis]RKL66420.1 glycosyltransferase family 1 protein [Salipaludibacillus neizhouensis]